MNWYTVLAGILILYTLAAGLLLAAGRHRPPPKGIKVTDNRHLVPRTTTYRIRRNR